MSWFKPLKGLRVWYCIAFNGDNIWLWKPGLLSDFYRLTDSIFVYFLSTPSFPFLYDLSPCQSLCLSVSLYLSLRLSVCYLRASFGEVSRRTWCTPAIGRRTASSTRSPATAASTAGCRSAWKWACPRSVSTLRCYSTTLPIIQLLLIHSTGRWLNKGV